MGDTYTTIKILPNVAKTHQDIACFPDEIDRLPLGKGAVVPLPAGFVLWRETCPTCHGAGDCALNVCPDCRGAGGWPTLWAPCATCKGTGSQHLLDGGKQVPCSAGCVNGYTRVGSPAEGYEYGIGDTPHIDDYITEELGIHTRIIFTPKPWPMDGGI